MNSWEINDVQQFNHDEKRIDIVFSTKGDSYYLVVKRDYFGVFYPLAVRHNTTQICTLCQRKGRLTECQVLDLHLSALFHQLIEVPSIRLEWLYLEHE